MFSSLKLRSYFIVGAELFYYPYGMKGGAKMDSYDNEWAANFDDDLFWLWRDEESEKDVDRISEQPDGEKSR